MKPLQHIMWTLCRSRVLLSYVRKNHHRHMASRSFVSQVLNNVEDTEFTTCGQPTSYSHPHLLNPGELIPGFKVKDFVLRRHLLMKKLFSNSHTQSLYNIVVIPSNVKIYMTEKIPYVFRQNTDYFYLTGCLEPDSVLVIHGLSDENFTTELFLRQKDVKAELWDGPRTGIEVASKLFAVDRAHPVEDLCYFLQKLTVERLECCLWYDSNSNNEQTNRAIKHILSNNGGMSLNAPKQFLHQLRLYKSENEQEMMRRTCKIASEAFIETIGFTKPRRTEHEVLSKFDYEIKMKGAQLLAYPPVVASGNNANIIHYIQNNQMCYPGDLLLMDAGCELNGYDSDITRTWPVSGKFTDEQKVLYEIVLDTQLTLIKLCENLPSLDELFSTMCTLLGSSFVKNHLVTKTYAAMNSYSTIGFKFCPHHVSHYLGMDVHDCALIPRTVPLAPGVVFTIEPGAYIGKDCQEARPEFRGLGVRIEDDILINNAGNVENLTISSPKSIKDIETVYTLSKEKV